MKNFEIKLDEIIAELQEMLNTEVLYSDYNKKHDAEFMVCFDKETKEFFYTITGGTVRVQKTMLIKAIKRLKSPNYKYRKLGLEDIYDMTSLTYAENIFELVEKMMFVVRCC